MKILATESLIIRFANYNSTKLMKRDSTKGIIVGTGQFYPGKSSIFSSLRRGVVQSYEKQSFFIIFIA